MWVMSNIGGPDGSGRTTTGGRHCPPVHDSDPVGGTVLFVQVTESRAPRIRHARNADRVDPIVIGTSPRIGPTDRPDRVAYPATETAANGVRGWVT